MSDYAARSTIGPSAAPARAQARSSRPLAAEGRRSKAGGERALAFFLAAALLLALAAAAAFLVPPLLLVTRYEIVGNSAMTKEDVLSAALVHGKEYFFSLDASRVKAAVEADPRVASADVSKLFPDGLRIAVRERVPVAIVMVGAQGRASAVCVDAGGVVFAEAAAEEAAAVPVLSGLRFEGFRLGTRLPPELASLASSLGAIEASEPGLLSAFSEIRVVAPAEGGEPGARAPAELILYPLNQRIPVRVGASLDAPTLRSIILVLDVLGTKGLAATVQEIDFRTGTVVYRSKEGQTG